LRTIVLLSFPKQKLAVPQVRFLGILGDVVLEIPELLRAANDVIEWFRLPESTGTASCCIDLPSRVSHPTLTDSLKIGSDSKLNDRMYVIRHHDKPIEIVFRILIEPNCIADDLGQFGTLQQASTMTSVEFAVKDAVAESLEFSAVRGVQFI
jgi:hypothetical protein